MSFSFERLQTATRDAPVCNHERVPNQKHLIGGTLAKNKANRKRNRKKDDSFRRVMKFPQARGKTIEFIQLSVSTEEYIIDIRFKDKTSLTFDLEPCLSVIPEICDWRGTEYNPVRRWRPVHSKSANIPLLRPL